MTFYGVTLAWTIWFPDDGPRTETCRSVFNVLMCKFYKLYICAVVGIIIESQTLLQNMILLNFCHRCIWLYGYIAICFQNVLYTSSGQKTVHPPFLCTQSMCIFFISPTVSPIYFTPNSFFIHRHFIKYCL